MSVQRLTSEGDATHVSRREFLRSSAVSGALVASGSIACRPASPPESDVVTAALPPTDSADFSLEEMTIGGLREAMASGEWTARSVTEAYLARIEQLNQQGPELRAVIETNPDAALLADVLDRERGF